MIKRWVKKLLKKIGLYVQSIPRVVALHEGPPILEVDTDFIIADFLERRCKRGNVKFIQIGAYDGISGDPIHKYVVRNNWEGILLEPQSKYFEKLKKSYEGVNKLKFICKAIAEEAETKKLYTLKDPESGEMPSWAGQIASLNREVIMSHRWAIPNIEKKINVEEVECVTFMELIRDNNFYDVDIVQIDTEGYDHRIIEMMKLGEVHPSIIRFEHLHIEKSNYEDVLAKLLNNGYSVAFEKKDTIAYRRSNT